MQDLIQYLLKSLYVVVCGGVLIALLTVWVIVSRRSSVSRAWEPLVPIVNGALKREYMTAILEGTYQSYPIRATWLTGGAEDPDMFQVQLQTVARGADWRLHYGSRQFFGEQQWYVEAKHKILQQRLDASSILAEIQPWQGHPSISYKSDSGLITYEERGAVPKSERFRAELDLLVRLARINELANTGSYFG